MKETIETFAFWGVILLVVGAIVIPSMASGISGLFESLSDTVTQSLEPGVR